MPNKTFVNWTNETFKGQYDGENYTFRPGVHVLLLEGVANHFAKHLTDHALLEDGKRLDDQSREALFAKCFPGGAEDEEQEIEPDLPQAVQSLQQDVKEEKKTQPKKPGKKTKTLTDEATEKADDVSPDFEE